MKKLLLVSCLFIVGLVELNAQLVTNNTQTPAWIVQNVLLGGGVSASNITYNGNSVQIGTFDGVNSNCGLNDGMIMSSGDIAGAVGPNDQGGTTTPIGGINGPADADLNALAMVVNPNFLPTEDAAILEFDFVPDGDSISFNYVFGSEEYLEFVNSAYNDVFGFFLSGPGITGPYSNNSINIAEIPGTTQPVSINTLNDVSNSAFYIDNGDGWTAPQNTDPTVLQYDGFTVVMKAAALVQCGETYHIKIAISDAGDGSLDSGVFLEAGSFSSNLIQFTTEVNFGGNDSTLFEGCGVATLHLTRGGDVTFPDTVYFATSGQAINGVDYTFIPDTLYFLAGQDSLDIIINAFDDGIPEGPETVNLMAIVPTECYIDTALISFYIDEPPPILISLSNDTTLTCGDSTLVVGNITGGYGPYVINWNAGIPDGDTLGWVSPLQTTDYEITVTDTCGVVTEMAQVTITIPQTPPLVTNIMNDTTVFCPESPVELTSAGAGGTAPYTYLWSGPLGVDSVANVAPPVTETYSLTVTDACGLDTTDMVSVIVQYDTIQVAISNDTTICVGDIIQIGATPSLGYNGYTYAWSNGNTDQTQMVSPLNGTNYSVTVTDGCAISASNMMWVGTSQPIADFAWLGSIHVENLPIQFQDNSFNAYQWSWDFGNGSLFSSAQNPYVTYPDDGLYTVMLAVWDALGCTDTAYSDILVSPEFQFYAPNAFSPDGDGTNDVFYGSGVGIQDYELLIFDRWGKVIFETDELYGYWDGTIGGSDEVAPEGVYVYKFRLRSLTGMVEEKFGHITLIK